MMTIQKEKNSTTKQEIQVHECYNHRGKICHTKVNHNGQVHSAVVDIERCTNKVFEQVGNQIWGSN